MKNIDTIDVQFHGDERGRDASLVLNGVPVYGCFDVMAFVATGGLRHVEVEIMTCSCGNAGCAGIFYGTRIKRRRRTIEWRDIDCGLPKRFYSFDSVAYDTLVLNTIDRLREIAEAREQQALDGWVSDEWLFDDVSDFESRLDYARNWIMNYRSK